MTRLGQIVVGKGKGVDVKMFSVSVGKISDAISDGLGVS